MGIIIVLLILFGLFSFIQEGNGVFKSIVIVAVVLTLGFLAPMLLIPIVIIICIVTSKGY